MSMGLAPKLELKTLIPSLRLPDAWGEEISIWDLKGRKNLVLAFFPGGPCPECEGFIEGVESERSHYDDDNAAVFAIVRDAEWHAALLTERFHPPCPILYDKSGEAMEAYTRCLPAVLVTDKCQELYAQWIIGPGGEFPTQKEILDVLDLINLECPE